MGLRIIAMIAMKKEQKLAICGAIAVLAIIVGWVLWISEKRTSLTLTAFVVCEDKNSETAKVYWVDLAAGSLKGISGPIMKDERPNHLAFDPVHSRLYVSAEAAIAPYEWPMIAVSTHGGVFEVVNRFAPGSDYEQQQIGGRVLRFSKHSVNRVLVSPDGNELYVDHRGLLGTAVWDSSTGDELRVLSNHLDANDFVSPNGKYIYDINPECESMGSRPRSIQDCEFQAEVRGFSTRTGNLTYRRLDNHELHAPGGHTDEPFLSFRPGRESNELRVYDRNTGEIISEFDVNTITDMKLAHYPRVLHNGRFLAVTMRTTVEQRNSDIVTDGETYADDYAVLIDVIDQRVVTRTKVGAFCTNTVINAEYGHGS